MALDLIALGLFPPEVPASGAKSTTSAAFAVPALHRPPASHGRRRARGREARSDARPDFNPYLEVAVEFDDEISRARLANRCDREAPTRWDRLRDGVPPSSSPQESRLTNEAPTDSPRRRDAPRNARRSDASVRSLPTVSCSAWPREGSPVTRRPDLLLTSPLPAPGLPLRSPRVLANIAPTIEPALARSSVDGIVAALKIHPPDARSASSATSLSLGARARACSAAQASGSPETGGAALWSFLTVPQPPGGSAGSSPRILRTPPAPPKSPNLVDRRPSRTGVTYDR
jgi:hypothetical protein